VHLPRLRLKLAVWLIYDRHDVRTTTGDVGARCGSAVKSFALDSGPSSIGGSAVGEKGAKS
jgi:hypothetical protein